MPQNNEIRKELKELDSPLAGFARTMPYVLPEGYLSMLAEALAQGVAWSEGNDPILTLSKAAPFDVPEEYLAALPQTMLNVAQESDIASGATMPYNVPDKYFALLPATLLAAARAADEQTQRGKVIPFSAQWQRRMIQWAAAAVLVMGLGLGAYKYTQPVGPDTVAARQLAKMDGEAINTYIAQHVDEFDTETLEASVVTANVDLRTSIATLDEEEIREYLSDDADVSVN